MFKRDESRESQPYIVPGTDIELVGQEVTAYKAASRAIEYDLSLILDLRDQLSRLEKVHWENSDSKPFTTLDSSEGEWNAHAQLFKFLRSEIFLCRQGQEWAVIQQFQATSPYAKANGQTEILLKGREAHEVVTEYLYQVEHTLRFMARNAVAHAQQIAWDQFPENDPAKVVCAISEQCALAVENPELLKQARTIRQNVRHSQGMSI